MEIVGKDAYSTWKSVLKSIVDRGIRLRDEEGRDYIELDNVTTTISSVDGIDRPITVLNSLEKWVYPSLDEIEEIIMGRENSDYRYSYGKRLFGTEGKSQIDDFVIPLLKERANSRRAVAVSWDPKIDSDLRNSHVAGIICIDFKIRGGKLDVSCLIRSNDMFFGWPSNVYQLYVLQKYVANSLKVGAGKIAVFSTSAHVYEDQKKYISRIVSRPASR